MRDSDLTKNSRMPLIVGARACNVGDSLGGFWREKRVLVTGGAGFIGSHLVETLVQKGAKVRVVDNLLTGSLQNLASCISRIEFVKADLMDQKSCEDFCKDMDVVFHLAAKVAGVGYNISHPATMFYANSMINLHILEAARRRDVERFLVVSSACVYPRFCTIPTPEDEGFIGDPEPSNLGYGWAKRLAEIQARTYAMEYNMKIGVIRPYNAYGPRDHFDQELGHVIPALIGKILEGHNPLVVWGRGEQSRSFVFVTDVVKGMLLTIEKHPIPEPINIGSDKEEIKIKDLVRLIIRLTNRSNIKVVFDASKPAGQPRRAPDTSKAKNALGYEPEVNLEEGLRQTIKWYKLNVWPRYRWSE